MSLFFDSYSCCFGQIISCQGSVAFSSDSCHRQAVTGCRIFFLNGGAVMTPTTGSIFQLVYPAGNKPGCVVCNGINKKGSG